MLWRIRAARLNMQITKCFIGNGLELRVPTPIWALCLMLFYADMAPTHIYNTLSYIYAQQLPTMLMLPDALNKRANFNAKQKPPCTP